MALAERARTTETKEVANEKHLQKCKFDTPPGVPHPVFGIQGCSQCGRECGQTSSLFLQFREQGFNLLLQDRQVTLHRLPDLIEVNGEVFMHENISHGNDLGPRDLRVCLVELRRQSCSSLTDHLQMVNHPDLKELVVLKGFPPPAGILLNPGDCLQNIL